MHHPTSDRKYVFSEEDKCIVSIPKRYFLVSLEMYSPVCWELSDDSPHFMHMTTPTNDYHLFGPLKKYLSDEFMNIIHFQQIIIMKLQGFDVAFAHCKNQYFGEQLGQIFG
ncbi:hypothetical protein CDAR_23091 [Caerostris darwini]|uniref:Uncharacterized protein n=1 Tax=Caerostris darwini TaxID=1538125 RepID=A0AAV4W155_9ARAC|nr:hypothetical protein CDAR_498381 [Caerostris darwini]GIY76133.1 hypothetical protein CDAR_23091 [Caerostris darwini]